MKQLECKGFPTLFTSEVIYSNRYILLLWKSYIDCCCPVSRATQIKTYSWDNAQVILVGNKADLEDDRLVPAEDGQRLADELGRREHTHTHCLPLALSLSLRTDRDWLTSRVAEMRTHTHTHECIYSSVSCLSTLKDRLTLVYRQYTPRK